MPAFNEFFRTGLQLRLVGDPLDDLFPIGTPPTALIGVYATPAHCFVTDGRATVKYRFVRNLIERAQQQIRALVGTEDPRLNGIVAESGEQPAMLLIVEKETGRATVVPRYEGAAIFAQANPNPWLKAPTPEAK